LHDTVPNAAMTTTLPSPPLVSVVITTCNRLNDLIRCIDSVARSTHLPLELLVIDDFSSDATRRLGDSDIVDQHPRFAGCCRVIHNASSLKMVKARNVGARAARGVYVLFIDDDNVIEDTMIARLVAHAEQHPKAGVIGPAMCYLSDRRRYLDYQTINLFTGRTRGHVDPPSEQRAVCRSDGVPNVFMVRAEVFQKVGSFDEALIQTFTEPDFGFNIARHGYESVVVKDAITFHDVPSGYTPRSLGGQFKVKAYCTMRNRAVLISRYGRWYHVLVYEICFAWAWALLYSALVLRYGRFDLVPLYLYGWLDGLAYCLTGRLDDARCRRLTGTA
jgi:GT2 family glycosyltransferase